MPELEPITREEKFLNGEVGMTPITREEKILAGEDIETVTRREYFLKKYRGGGGGDITVEEITITENGTTTAPSGKAYSPIHTNVPQPTLSTLEVSENGDYDAPSGTAYNRVKVNVPLPSNAYLLKSVNTPTPIASFSDGEEMVMPSLKVAIEPQQDLHGYDSPWVGGGGANKWDEEWQIGDIDGITGEVKSGPYLISKNPIPVEPDTANYFYIPSLIYIFRFDESQNLLGFEAVDSSKAVTIPSNTHYIRFRNDVRDTSQTYGNNISINYPSSVTTYAPYSNICPISGWDEVDLTVADDVDNPTISNAYTIDLDGTRYGGEVDVVNGGGTANMVSLSLNSISGFSSDAVNEGGYIRYNCSITGKAHNFNILCDKIKVIQSVVQATANEELISGSGSNDKLYFIIDSTRLSGDLTTSTGRSNALKTLLATNDIQVVYELATPTTYDTQPTAIKSLRGVNNVYANTGDIKDAEYFSKEV